MGVCSNCGRTLPEGSSFCPGCGAAVFRGDPPVASLAQVSSVSVATSDPTVVQLADGPVSLVTLSELEAKQTALQGEVARLRLQAMSLGAQAGTYLQRAGTLLLGQIEWWNGAGANSDLIESCKSLNREIEAKEARLQDLAAREHHGIGGVLSRVGESVEKQRTASEKAHLENQLRPQLIELAVSAPTATFPDADVLRAQAHALQNEAHAMTDEADRNDELYRQRALELSKRREAAKAMGFDALLTAAQLQADGLTPIASPLVTKRGESAFYSAHVTLARHKTRTRIVGGSHGFSFPIGHTGIRYRVGSFQGQPVSQDYLARIDTGTLVVTNQRVAFVGATRSVTFPLDKILHAEVYTDGVGMFKEGKESADLFLFSDARRFMMYLNYLLDKHSA